MPQITKIAVVKLPTHVVRIPTSVVKLPTHVFRIPTSVVKLPTIDVLLLVICITYCMQITNTMCMQIHNTYCPINNKVV